MKKFLSTLTLIAMLASSLALLAPVASSAAENDDNVLFSMDDVRAANENGELESIFTPVDADTTTIVYNEEEDRVEVTNPGSWKLFKLNLPQTAADTTQSNWLQGKTLEYEVVIVKNETNNLTLTMHTYSETSDSSNPQYSNDDNNGPAIWWYSLKSTLASVNAYPVGPVPGGTAYEHTIAEKIVYGNEGTAVKFRMVQTAERLIHCYYDETTAKWIAIDDGHAIADLKVNQGAAFFSSRPKDTWGIKNLTVYSEALLPDASGDNPGGDIPEIEKEPTQESDSKYLISQETFRKAKNVASFFPAIGEPTSGYMFWQNGANQTAVTYDHEADMVLFDTRKNGNIQGNTLSFEEFDSSKENAFMGYTVEYELVLVDINDSNPMAQIGLYFDDFENVDNGCAIRWYMTSGNLTMTNCEGGFSGIYDITGFKKEEGDSVKFKLICDEYGITSYYDDGDGWKLMGITETDELYFNQGDMWFAFRNGDVYGMKNFAMYKNEESNSWIAPDDDDDGDNDPDGETTTDGGEANTDTSVTSDEGAPGTTGPADTPDKGCGSAVLPSAAVLMLAATVPVTVASCKRKKK